MILDPSALVAILYGEPEGPSFLDLIGAAEVCRMSVANVVELSMVVPGRRSAAPFSTFPAVGAQPRRAGTHHAA